MENNESFKLKFGNKRVHLCCRCSHRPSCLRSLLKRGKEKFGFIIILSYNLDYRRQDIECVYHLFLILNEHLHNNILLTKLLTKSLYQLHYLQNYSTTLPKRYREEHKAVSTLRPINAKIKSTNKFEGKEKRKENKKLHLNPRTCSN